MSDLLHKLFPWWRCREYERRLQRIIDTPHATLHCALVSIAKGEQ